MHKILNLRQVPISRPVTLDVNYDGVARRVQVNIILRTDSFYAISTRRISSTGLGEAPGGMKYNVNGNLEVKFHSSGSL